MQEKDINTEELSFDDESATQIIEASLFAAGYPVSFDRISDVIGISNDKVKELLKVLAKKYSPNKSGIQLLIFDDCAQLCTKEKFLLQVKSILGIRRGGNLSKSSLEVLAIIAYNQPVTRSYIEQIRSVECSYTVSSLLEKGLIEVCGRLDAPGRPSLYRTTTDFLRIFGMSSLSELPPYEFTDSPEQLAIKL